MHVGYDDPSMRNTSKLKAIDEAITSIMDLTLGTQMHVLNILNMDTKTALEFIDECVKLLKESKNFMIAELNMEQEYIDLQLDTISQVRRMIVLVSELKSDIFNEFPDLEWVQTFNEK